MSVRRPEGVGPIGHQRSRRRQRLGLLLTRLLGSLFPLGATDVTCSAQDAAGNIAASNSRCGSGGRADTTSADDRRPRRPDAVEATPPANGATVTFTARPPATPSTGRLGRLSPVSGSLFPLGTTTVNCTAHDAAGEQRRLALRRPRPRHHAPELQRTPSLTVEAAPPTARPSTPPRPPATPSTAPSRSPAPPPPAASSPLGTTDRQLHSHDAAGNNAACSFTILVRDTTPPTIAAHANLTVEATAANGATVSYTAPTASDAVDGAVTVSCLPASGSLFPLATTTVTCTATTPPATTPPAASPSSSATPPRPRSPRTPT